MPTKRPQPGDLEAIETASRDEISALQLERLQVVGAPPYDNVEPYRKRCQRKGRPSGRPQAALRSGQVPFMTKTDLGQLPFGLFAVPRSKVAACTPRAAPPASRWWSATPRTTSTTGPTSWPARSRAAGAGPATWCITPTATACSRRPGRPRRRRAPGLHRGADVRRPDREAGPADHGLPPDDHHGHAVVLAGDRRGVRAPGHQAREISLKVGIFGAEPWGEGMRGEIERSSASTPSTSTASPR